MCKEKQSSNTHVSLENIKTELTHALNKRDYKRLKRRLAHAKEWLEDSYLPQESLGESFLVNDVVTKTSRNLVDHFVA